MTFPPHFMKSQKMRAQNNESASYECTNRRARISFQLRPYLATSICISHWESSIIKGELPFTYKKPWSSTTTIRILYWSLKENQTIVFSFESSMKKRATVHLWKSWRNLITISAACDSLWLVRIKSDIPSHSSVLTFPLPLFSFLFCHEQNHEQRNGMFASTMCRPHTKGSDGM